MAKNKKNPDKWVVTLNYSTYENLLLGGSLTLTFDKEKKHIIVTENKKE